MKVIITNATGSGPVEAMLDKDSGIIEYKTGEISHVLHEKSYNKIIFVVKDAPKKGDPDLIKPETSLEQGESVKAKNQKAK